MKRNHLIAGAVTVAALAGGTAGAVAATSDDKAAEQTVLSDAAKQLGVSADELRAALSKAEDAQIDAEVKAGRLTQAQADEIKQHRQSDGSVLGFGHGGHGPGDHGGPGHGGPGGRFLFDDAAKAIGISEETLFGQLREGKSLTAIAKAHGKTLADVKAAVEQAATERLDADLKAGRITQAERDEEVGELDEELQHLGDVGGPRFHGGPRP
jgi:transposase-like protein